MGARLIENRKMEEIDKVTLSLAVKDALYQKLLSHNKAIHRNLQSRFQRHKLVYTGEKYDSKSKEEVQAKETSSTATPTGLKTLQMLEQTLGLQKTETMAELSQANKTG